MHTGFLHVNRGVTRINVLLLLLSLLFITRVIITLNYTPLKRV